MVRATRSSLKTELVEPPATPPFCTSQEQLPTSQGSTTTLESSEMAENMDFIPNGVHEPGPDAMQSLGGKSRALIQAIQKLEALRIDTTLPSLPKFVVVGDQSHGKSSIIEAVCNITLPRGASTCTRCPFRITTTDSKDGAEWKCEISLLYRFAYNSRSRSRWEDTGEQNPVPFATVHDKAELGRVLRLAQLAVLNPGLPPGDILGGRARAGDGVKFSPNIISLDISAPDLPELSLFDLPGTINVYPNEDEQHLVGFIEKLVKNYLGDKKALVLLAASANQDLECSLAAKFILTCKANNRSMGVLTKPDLVTNERVKDVRMVLAGESFRLGGGWFVTKHSSQEEIDRGISHAEARSIETAFFQGPPWSTELAEFAGRFGIPSLQEALSLKLTQHILNDLPEITSRVDSRLGDVREELGTFPPESKEPCFTVMSEIDSFDAHFIEQLKGESLKNDFRQSWRYIFHKLARLLADARPNVMLSSAKQHAIAIDSDEDEEEDDSTSEPSPSKRSKGTNGHANETPSRHNDEARLRRTPIKTEDGEPRTVVKMSTFTLNSIRKSYEDGRGSELPEKNWKVTIALITESLVGWNEIVETTLKSVNGLLLEMLQKSIDATLGGRRGTKMYEEVWNIAASLFKTLMSQQWQAITHYVHCECHKPTTYQQAHLTEKLSAVKDKLKEARAETRAKEYMDKFEIKINAAKPEDRKKKFAEITAKLPRDEYSTEIDSVARVLSYYDLAAGNLPDVIAKMLEYGLLHRLQTGLKTQLRRDLKALDATYCLRLLAEDPAREEKRLNLLAEQEKLNEALSELRGLSLA